MAASAAGTYLPPPLPPPPRASFFLLSFHRQTALMDQREERASGQITSDSRHLQHSLYVPIVPQMCRAPPPPPPGGLYGSCAATFVVVFVLLRLDVLYAEELNLTVH